MREVPATTPVALVNPELYMVLVPSSVAGRLRSPLVVANFAT